MAAASSDATHYDVIIERPTSWLDFRFHELWKHRYLILLFVRRDLVAFYSQTILGPLWFVISPLASVATFIVVFGHIAKIPTNGMPHGLFYLSGLVIWNYFTSCVTKTSDFLAGNSHVMSKIYFPRLSIPLATVTSSLIPFFIQFLLLIVVSIYYAYCGVHFRTGPAIVFVPLIVAFVGIIALTFGMLISSLTTLYRDISHLVGLFTTILMYASPIIYPVSQIPDKWHKLYLLNPMATAIELFRYCLFGEGVVSVKAIAVALTGAAICLFFTLVFFNRIEKSFVDTV
jgi:lipopolysaccharide transport system permease protein